jgi:hypothetical protein
VRSISATIAALASIVAIGASACGSGGDLASRQAAVAGAGAEVMPFSLDETTHIFSDTPTGGREDVVADDPSDQVTIEQIREHLTLEAGKFRRGDFSDPEAIHGPDMPGLAALKAGFNEIVVDLVETDDGAAIIFTTQDPDLIKAIHSWFAAQAMDHGSHAEHQVDQ